MEVPTGKILPPITSRSTSVIEAAPDALIGLPTSNSAPGDLSFGLGLGICPDLSLGLGLGRSDDGKANQRSISPSTSAPIMSSSRPYSSLLQLPSTPPNQSRTLPSGPSTKGVSPSLNSNDPGRQPRTPSPLFGFRPASRASGRTGSPAWSSGPQGGPETIGNGKETISPSKPRKAGTSREDVVERVKTALFGHRGDDGWASPTDGSQRYTSNGRGNVFNKDGHSPSRSSAMVSHAESSHRSGNTLLMTMTQAGNAVTGSQRSGRTIRRSTIHAGDETKHGAWLISVGWAKEGGPHDTHGQFRAWEGDEVDIYVNAPTHQDTLKRTLGEIKELDMRLRRSHAVSLPALPEISPFSELTASPKPTASAHTQASQATNSSSASGHDRSPKKKSRQNSFFSALSSKMRSTIRGSSGTSGTSNQRPALLNRESEPQPPTAKRIASSSPKRATIHLSEGAGLGLGHFFFEDEKGDVPVSSVGEVQNAPSSTSVERSNPSDMADPPPIMGEDTSVLSFQDATTLVAAMAEHPGLAHLASLPESSLNGETGVPPTPIGAVVGPIPPMSLAEALLASPAEMDDALGQTRRSDEHNLVTSLSAYLSEAANEPSIRAMKAWKLFMDPRASDLTHGTERQERALWKAHGEEILAKNSPPDTGDAIGSANSTQRMKAIKRSRSLGNGILTGIFGHKGIVPSSTSVAAATEPAPDAADKELPTLPDKNELSSPAADLARLLMTQKEIPPIPSDTTAAAESTTSTVALEQPTDLPVDAAVDAKEQPVEHASPPTASTTPHLSMTSDSDTQPTSLATSEISPYPTDATRGRRGRRGVQVDDFDLLKVLGRGCAGKVVLVKHKETASLFAMKIIVKKHVLAHSELQHTLTEQSVLKRVAQNAGDSDSQNPCPFVVKLWYSFFDSENLYLVLDFHPGGDLATQLARWGRLGRDRARFYTSEIVEGVEGLHAAGVIYRDLKPENVLLASDGHIVLVDFGLAAWFPESKGPIAALPLWMGGSLGDNGQGRPSLDRHVSAGTSAPIAACRDTATSFVGTAEYLAPEVIKGDPYSYAVDWWSLGTMLYEALMGSTPFWAENHADMYTRVVHEPLSLPDNSYLDKDTRAFLRGLLHKDPAFRLCEPRIKTHPYLSMVDFDHVRHKRYIPPYIPPMDSSKDFDTQNFDAQFLNLSPALGADGPGDDASQLGGGDSEEAKHDVVVDDSVFSGYNFKDRQILSVFAGEDEVEGIGEWDSEGRGAEKDPLDTPTETAPPSEADGVTSEVGTPTVEGAGENTPKAGTVDSEASVREATGDGESLVEDDVHTVEQPVGTTPTPAMIQRIQSIASADHIKASNRRSRDFTTIGRASMEQLNRLSSPLSNPEARASPPPRLSEDDDWDLIDDNQEQVRNGGDTFFGLGVVDKYKLALLRRKESTVRRKQSANLRRSPSSSLFMAGNSGWSGNSNNANLFKSRLKLRTKSPKKPTATAPPPLSRGASQSHAIANEPHGLVARSNSETPRPHGSPSKSRRVSGGSGVPCDEPDLSTADLSTNALGGP